MNPKMKKFLGIKDPKPAAPVEKVTEVVDAKKDVLEPVGDVEIPKPKQKKKKAEKVTMTNNDETPDE
jgi:hypothetical protein